MAREFRDSTLGQPGALGDALERWFSGPAWGGNARAREASLELGDRPRCTGLRFPPPLVVPGAPDGLAAIAGELIGGEQHRRDMRHRDEALVGLEGEERARAVQDLPKCGERGVDEDLRALGHAFIAAVPVGADLRLVPWRWLRWAALDASPSVRSVLAAVPRAAALLEQLPRALEALAGEGSFAVSGWGVLDREVLAVQDEVRLYLPAYWACAVIRFAFSALPGRQGQAFHFAASAWFYMGGDVAAGLRELTRLTAEAPAWPAEVSA